MLTDAQGNRVAGATPAALEHYDDAVAQLQCYRGDPLAAADAALLETPTFAMAHALRAHLHLLGTDVAGLPEASLATEAAARTARDDRDRGHVAALRAFIDGDLVLGSKLLDDVLVHHPRDSLALQAAHLWDFYLGDARSLRDRVARALPAWQGGVPGRHAVLGMHAFGLEETGDYGGAERQGREAVALERRDAWAQHAVAHVMEMQGRHDEGVAWMEGNRSGWAEDSFMAVHNWWHLALYHLDRGDMPAVLRLYDDAIRAGRSGLALDMVDASALLWRLSLLEVDVVSRWDELADAWAPYAEAPNYAFNNVHALMAFIGAGRDGLVERTLAALARRGVEDGTNGMMAREVGFPVARALVAFAKRNYGETIRILRPVRMIAHRFGGSHAQRDVLDLTLIEAALRQRDVDLARALTAERSALRPASPLARGFAQRAARMGASTG